MMLPNVIVASGSIMVTELCSLKRVSFDVYCIHITICSNPMIIVLFLNRHLEILRQNPVLIDHHLASLFDCCAEPTSMTKPIIN